MTGPSHVASYYAATADPSPAFAPLEGEVAADVCVVGAGFTGLSAALHLAERGYAVVLLEAARVAWGASGRNGGQMIVGYAPGALRTAELVGAETARRLWDMGLEAVELVRQRVARHHIRCDLKPGYALAAAKRRHMTVLARAIDLLVGGYGYDKARLVERDELAAMVATGRYAGGVLDLGSGHLHPLNYALGLAAAARAAGVRMHEESRVIGVTPRAAAGTAVRTARGTVTAPYVVLAGNAYLGELVPAIRARIMPVGTYMIATESLGAERARALVRDDICVCDTKFVLDYFRLSADHRMLFGGRVSYTAATPRRLAGLLRRNMVRTFPELADASIEFAWGGHVAITRNRLPHFGRAGQGVFFAHGFSGHGVALTGLAGKLIAEAVAGSAERFDVFSRIPHRRFPGGRLLRSPLLAAAMLYYRLRDLL